MTLALPPLLYRFQTVTPQNLANLSRAQIFFARPSCFNDPFDCGIRVDKEVTPEEMERIFRAWPQEHDGVELPGSWEHASFQDNVRRAFDRVVVQRIQDTRTNRGVVCLSAVFDHSLLWAHYAGGHRGYCLAFDTAHEPFNQARPVSYRTELPAHSATSLIDGDDTDLLWSMVLTKEECWQYEQEWRLIHMQPDHQFGVHGALRAVYFGCEMPLEHAELVARLIEGEEVELWQMDRKPRGFGLQPR